MAHLVWRRGTKAYLYYYDTRSRKLVQVSRTVTKEWDNKPSEEVQRLKHAWEEENGQAVDRIERIVLAPGDKLKQLWDSYQTSRMRFKKRRAATAKHEDQLFINFICKFFLSKHQKKDPTQWHALVPDFHNWLFEQTLADSSRRKILWALERFGKYLVFSRVMTFPFTIQTPTRDNSKITPLKVRVEPLHLLKLVRSHSFRRPHKKHANTDRVCQINFKLAILLGYFASLRPEEMWALDKEDFLTGARAEESSKTYGGLIKANLGSRLAVRVNKTITQGKVERLVKSHHSYGYVTVWHADAARLIADIVRDLPGGRLFPFTRGYVDKAWREIVAPILKATAHDLRRASGLYLGRTVRIPPTLLQDHMRHAELDTTLCYMREPSAQEDEKPVADQNFDDVG